MKSKGERIVKRKRERKVEKAESMVRTTAHSKDNEII
jgi:hypothetical protein